MLANRVFERYYCFSWQWKTLCNPIEKSLWWTKLNMNYIFSCFLQRFQNVKWKMNDQINSHLKYSHLIISITISDHIHNFWFRIQYVNVIKIWLTIEFLAFGRPMLLKQGAGIEQFEGLQISSFNPYGKGDFFKRNPSKNL